MSAQAFPAALRAREPGSERPSPAPALGVLALCLLGLAAVWVLAAIVPATHVRDVRLLEDFMRLSGPGVDRLARFLLHLLDPLLFVLWGVALLALALARERPRVAVAILAVMALAPLSAELLKPLVAHPHARVNGAVVLGAASWPSGHSTAALALVLCAVLASPPRWRPLVAGVGGAYVLAVAVSLLILAWHMPSDVVGGYLLATAWMALAVAVLRAAERRWPTAPEDRAPPRRATARAS